MGLDEKTAALVLRQVEFYFSDSNLPGDKFLRQCVEEAADGMVSLPLICSFGRMRSHLNLKESGPDNVPPETAAAVAEVLRKSTVLKVSEDGLKVGRTVPMSKFEEVQAAIEARSIAVGPLRWNVTMEEVEAFFSQHTKVKSVRLPRHPGGKAFCGSAILELESEEEAKKALDFKLVFDGVEQEIRAKKDFDAEMEMKQVKAREESYEQRTARKDAEIRFTKGLIVAFFLQKVDSAGESEKNNVKKEEPMSVDTEKSETMKGSPPADGVSCEESVAGEDESAKEKDELAQGEVKPAAEADTTKEELEPSKEELDVSREDIKEAFKGFGFIKYVDYSRGASSGYLRFDKPEEVQKARTAAVLAESGGIVVKDYIATLEAVDGAAEEEYWRNIYRSQDKVRGDSGRPKGGRGNDRFRGGRGGRPYEKSRRENSHDGGQGKGGRGKPLNDGTLGKHKRFDEGDNEAEAGASARKQVKSEEITCKQSDAEAAIA